MSTVARTFRADSGTLYTATGAVNPDGAGWCARVDVGWSDADADPTSGYASGAPHRFDTEAEAQEWMVAEAARICGKYTEDTAP